MDSGTCPWPPGFLRKDHLLLPLCASHMIFPQKLKLIVNLCLRMQVKQIILHKIILHPIILHSNYIIFVYWYINVYIPIILHPNLVMLACTITDFYCNGETEGRWWETRSCQVFPKSPEQRPPKATGSNH